MDEPPPAPEGVQFVDYGAPPPVTGQRMSKEEAAKYVRPLPAAATAEAPGVLDQALSGAGDVAKGMWGIVKRAAVPPDTSDKAGMAARAVAGPLGPVVLDMMRGQASEAGKAVDLAKRGRALEAGGHAMAAALPMVGALAAQVGETAGGVPQMPPQQQIPGEENYVPPQPVRAGAQVAATLLGPKAVKGAAKATSAAADLAGNVAAGSLGKLTGAGGEAIKTVFKNPTPEAMAAMRGRVQPIDIVNDVKSAVDNAMEARRQQYAQTRAGLEGQQAPVDISGAEKTLNRNLERFRVDRPDAWPEPEGPGGNYTPEQMQTMIRAGRLTENKGGVIEGPNGGSRLDFSRSALSPGAQSDVVAVTKLVQGWPDRTPLGIDALIRRVGDYYSENGQARAFVQAVKKSLQEDLTRQYPDYGKMVGDYADASELINNAMRELSTNNKNPGVAVRKLTYALNQNNNYRQMLIEGLQDFAGKDLKGEIAGQHLSTLMPRGIAGHVGAGALFAYLGHPHYLAYLALTSPRLVGELAAAAGKVSNAASTPMDFLKKGPVRVPVFPAIAPENGNESEPRRTAAVGDAAPAGSPEETGSGATETEPEVVGHPSKRRKK